MYHSFPRLCCSFAERPSKVGVAYHNAAYQALGLDYTYVAFAVQDVPAAVQSLRILGIRGCGVTMPHKLTVLPHLDRLDPHAAAIKAVNTIVNDDGILTGYNADWIGATKALEEVTSLAGQEAVVIGAGGSSRAIIYALIKAGASVRLYNRTLENAIVLAKEFELVSVHPIDELPQVGHYDIIVNTTSVGHHTTGESIIPESLLRPDTVVFDVVAEPLETTLLAQARAKGAKCATGFRMRLFQAAEQFRLYTGVEPPLEVMEAALIKASKSH